MAEIDALKFKIAADVSSALAGLAQLDKQLATVGTAAVKSTEQINQGYTSAAKGVRSISEQLSSLQDVMAKGAVALGAVASIRGIGSALVEAQQSAEKLKNTLEYSVGASKVAGEMEYLRTVTRNMGVDFATASQAYGKFTAAVKGTGISIGQTKTIFEGVAGAAAKMGLSADETQGAFLALSQMASKGTVSAEELRGQLAERLPGALRIAAQAMGVTDKEFNKLLETGQIMASDFLPKFGQALKDNFQAPVNSLTQEINRLNSAWDQWKQSLADADGGGFKFITNGLNESSAAMRALGKEAGVVHKLLVAIGGFQAGAIGAGKFDTAKIQQDAMADLDRVVKARRGLESRNLNYLEQESLRDLIRQEKALRDDILSLATQRGQGVNIKPDLKGEFADQSAKRKTAFDGYMKDVQSEKEKQTAIEKDRFTALTAIIGTSGKEYETAFQAHKEKLAEINKKGAAGGANNDLAQIAKASLDELRNNSQLEIELVKDKVAQRLVAEAEGIEQIKAIQIKAGQDEIALLSKQYAGTKDNGERARLLQDMNKISNAVSKAVGDAETAMFRLDEKAIQANEKATKALQDEADVLIEKAKAAEFENAQIGMTADQLAILTERRYDERIELLQDKAAAIEMLAGRGDEVEAIEKQISALQRLKGAEVARPKLAQQAKEWEKFSDDINRALTDALMRGFESGKSFGQNFVDSLKNSLKTAGLKLVVNYVTGGAGQAMSGVFGTSLGGSASGGASGLASDASNAYSLGSSVYQGYNTISTGAGTLPYTEGLANAYGVVNGDTLGNLVSLNPQWTSTAAETASSTGSLGSTLGTAAGVVGAGLTAYNVGGAVANKYGNVAGTAAGTLAGVGTYAVGSSIAGSVAAGTGVAGGLGGAAMYSALAAVPVWGWVAAAVVALAGALSGGGGKKVPTGITSLRGGFVDTGDGEYEGFIGQSGMEYKKKGKTSVEWSDVDAQLNADLTNMYKSVKDGLIATGKVFEDYTLEDKAKGFVALVDVSNTTNMNGVFAALTEQVTQGLGNLMFPSIAGLVKTTTVNGMAVAEQWSQVFARVLAEVAAVGNVFDLLGKDFKETFGTGNADRVLKLSDNFVQLFGTIESMNQRVGAYYENFYSGQEKTDFAWEKMQQAFDGIQQVMPTTREGFRKLVDSLDLATESGGAAFKALMDLQGGFAALTPEIVSLTEAQKKAQITEQLGTALGAAKSVTDAAFDALQKAVDAEKNRLSAKFEDDKKAMQTSIDAAKNSVSALTSLFDTISAAVGTLIEQTDAQLMQERGAAQSALTAAVTAASNGQSLAPFAASITGAIETLKKPSENLYGSFEDYARAQGQANAALVALKNSSADQKSVQEMMLQALEDSLALQQSNYAQTIADLDAKVQNFKDQIDALRGIDNSVKSVEAAIADLAKALKKETEAKAAVNVNAGLVGGTTPSGDYLKDVVEYGQKYGSDAYYFGSTNDFAAKLEGWTMAAQALGVSLQEASGGQYNYFLEIQKQFDAGLHPTASGSGNYSDYTAPSISDSIAAAASASSAAQIENLYSNLLDRVSDSSGLANWTAQLNSGAMTIEAIAEAFKASDEYKNSHATGLDRVPYNGYQATLHEGEAVIDAASVSAIQRYFKITPLQSGGNSEEIRALRDEQRAQAAAFAAFMSRIAKVVEKWDGDGMPVVRDET